MKLLCFFFLITALMVAGCSDPCDKVSCANRGTCVDGECHCLDGFTGQRCEEENKCVTRNIECENGGVCEDGQCECLNGFSGESCEIEASCVDDCNSHGTCFAGTCDCDLGFSGPACGIEDKCLSQNVVCQNGGECVDGQCECLMWNTGDHCEIKRIDEHLGTYNGQWQCGGLEQGSASLESSDQGSTILDLRVQIGASNFVLTADFQTLNAFDIPEQDVSGTLLWGEGSISSGNISVEIFDENGGSCVFEMH